MPERPQTLVRLPSGPSKAAQHKEPWYMSWEQRGDKRYFYRNAWQDGRSVRTYLGTGEAAELAATAEALQRVQRERETR